jgi:hypothetical protein
MNVRLLPSRRGGFVGCEKGDLKQKGAKGREWVLQAARSRSLRRDVEKLLRSTPFWQQLRCATCIFVFYRADRGQRNKKPLRPFRAEAVVLNKLNMRQFSGYKMA